jgi:hypothetical protein
MLVIRSFSVKTGKLHDHQNCPLMSNIRFMHPFTSVVNFRYVVSIISTP